MGGRPEGVAHVVPGPGPSLHPVLEAGHGAGPSHPARDPKRARMGDMAPLRIDTREVKVSTRAGNEPLRCLKPYP